MPHPQQVIRDHRATKFCSAIAVFISKGVASSTRKHASLDATFQQCAETGNSEKKVVKLRPCLSHNFILLSQSCLPTRLESYLYLNIHNKLLLR